MIRAVENTLVMEEVTDPAEVAAAQARAARFERNWRWFQAHLAELEQHQRGKHLCIAGGELYEGDTAQEAFARAQAAHPDDDGCLVHFIPRAPLERIYAHRR